MARNSVFEIFVSKSSQIGKNQYFFCHPVNEHDDEAFQNMFVLNKIQ